MNGHIMIIGVFALATVIGHFTVRSKQFLNLKKAKTPTAVLIVLHRPQFDLNQMEV